MRNPWSTKLYDNSSKSFVPAKIALLTAETAEEYIDKGWWTGLDGEDNEDDRYWDWSKFIHQHRYGSRSKKYEFRALRTDDHAIQSAIILETNVQTPNYPPGVRICNLSSAPWNRFSLAGENRRYCGCGRQLVVFACIVTYNLGTQGAIVGYPLKNSIEFYTRLGFSPTGIFDARLGLELYELPPDSIEGILTENGLFA
ncbi:MAG TPA: hypothetical protein VHC22_00125 [Pirellulales bacterium]|nr:hypothetical protein [Pirellulales bacterium]